MFTCENESVPCVLLSAQKVINRQGDQVIRNGNETIAEAFQVTGVTDF